MLNFLKDHPFAVEAHFESSLVLSFAVPREEAQRLIPECLEADTFDDKWGFVAAAMVQTKSLRPKGFPRFLGTDFFLVGYRVFVRFTDENGKRSRGLYILGSATDKGRMEFFGNLFTHYNYKTISIVRKEESGIVTLGSEDSGFGVSYQEATTGEIALPEGSPFADWTEARRFAGPLPFTFTHSPNDDTILVIEGVRENWKPRPVNVVEYRFPFIDDLNLTDAKLANAFMVTDTPYYWKRGRRRKIPNR